MERQREGDLRGKVALITGASRGVGLEAALSFARRGVNLVLAARTVNRSDTLPGTLGEAMQKVEAMGVKALAVPTNVADREDLKKLVAAAEAEFGGVDILVNNAAATVGRFWQNRFLDLAYEDWLHQFDVNLHAPFTLMQRCTPIMARRGGGRIVNVTAGSAEASRIVEEPPQIESVAGKNVLVPGYSASKRALDRLGNAIAPEIARHNVFVVNLHPGWVETEMVAARLKDKPGPTDGPGGRPVPMAIPARMIVYFAACENPREYNGRVFWAERELADMGIPVD